MVNKCLTCGNFCSKEKDYCSDKCREGLCPKEEIRECKNCGEEIITTPSRDKKFCDMSCLREYEKENQNLKKECPECGEKFTTPKSIDSKYCSQKCMAENYTERFKEENNTWWKGGKIEKTCINCSEKFEVWPKRANAKYCSRECMSEDYTGKWVGEDHPNYSRISTQCANCNKKIERILFHYENHDKHFCCKDCEAEWLSKNSTGEDHPSWKGGFEPYYGENWRRQRRKALKRDDYKCQICGRSEEDLDRCPSVHHIKPKREFEDLKKANNLSNLVTLCRKHHKKVEGWNVIPSNIKG